MVLDRVSLTVHPGERIGVIGDNGSGKSTLLKLIAGVEHPDNGELVVVAPGGVGYLPQSLALPSHATVADAVDLALVDLRELEDRMRVAERALGTAGVPERVDLDAYAALVAEFEARGGYEADVRVDVALHGLGLPRLDRSRPLGTLSGGERSRLALAAVLASDPELLLLDEPTTGLDPQARHVLWDRLFRLKNEGVTVVVTTHYMDEAEQLCDRLVVMDHGRIVAEGSPRSLIEQHATREVLELRLQVDDHLAAAHLVDAIGDRVEALPDRLLLYTDHGDAALESVHAHGLEPISSIVRRSTLEDVFLHLTGRTLVD